MARRPAPRATLLALALALVFAGCSSASDDATTTTDGRDDGGSTSVPVTSEPEAEDEARTLTEDSTIGGDRPVQVQVPTGYDPAVPTPLVVLLHGYGVDGAIQSAYLRLAPAADAAGMLLVHPDGTPNAEDRRYWNATEACCGPDEGAPDDVAYVTGLLDEVAERYAVDPDRVYLVGHSNGGFMSFRMACERSDRIAAIATIAAATVHETDPEPCRPSEPVAVLAVHGTADETIRFDGGSTEGGPYPSADETAAIWAEANGCSATAEELPTGRAIIADLPDATVAVHDGCDPGGWVERWTQADGVHIPAFTDDIGEQLLAFLAEHPKP
jgi:polyhydroxybutyrate depolymerase